MSKKFTRDEDGVVIVKPDTSMKKRLGMGKSLKGLLGDSVIQKAEESMTATIPELMVEIKGALKELIRACANLKAGQVCTDELKTIIEKSFEVKGKSGFCNYPMATHFARFLYLYCEALVNEKMTSADINMISTCSTILMVIFERNFAGQGDNESLDEFLDDENDKSPFTGL
jgi:hypothetical protein